MGKRNITRYSASNGHEPFGNKLNGEELEEMGRGLQVNARDL